MKKDQKFASYDEYLKAATTPKRGPTIPMNDTELGKKIADDACNTATRLLSKQRFAFCK